MVIVIEVSVAGETRPPAGTPIRVEARDTSWADAPAETIASVEGLVRGEAGSWLDTVEIEIERVPEDCAIWAHIDVDGDGRVSPGDFVTTASHPVRGDGEVRVPVMVRMV